MPEIEDWTASPERLGFSREGLSRAGAVVREGCESGIYPAAVFLVLREGKVAAKAAVGSIRPGSQPPQPTKIDTIFDMASLTKPITATLLLQRAERGELHLGMRVADFLPEADDSPCGPLTLFQLATHTSGLPPWKPLYKTERSSALEEILATELEAEPGSRYAYCDLGYILLGAVLERITGSRLDLLAHEQIFEPLGMRDSGSCPAQALHGRIAATANCPMREGATLVGEVHDANAHSMGGVAGHAGLFSTAPDMARFAVSLLLREAAKRLLIPTVLQPLTVKTATSSQIDPAIGGHSIGWFTDPNGMLPRGDLFSELSFGHTGFAGTMLLHDPEYGVTIIFLTNRVYNAEDGTRMMRLRRLFANAVAGAID
jgi:CubicO group peptidase (beta-lactamase class C family)